MKKNLPYILIGIIASAIVVLFFVGRNRKEKEFDDRLTFRNRDKIPYGTYVAYNNLKSIFPNASIDVNKSDPGYWENNEDRQAYIIISPEFTPDEYEMKRIIRFIENGNDVFISTARVSFDAEKFLKCDIYYPQGFGNMFFMMQIPDSMTVSINTLSGNKSFTYPGKAFDFWFHGIDSLTSTVLGHNAAGNPDFIHLKAGKGNLFFHLAPVAFTNYFLLHKNNISYYEYALSHISPRTEKVIWDEYYLFKKSENRPERERSNWMSVFLRYPALKWAFITALLTLLIYVLLEMRRKQRQIPVITKPRNDSLDFVKTIGRLYHDKGDHKNLCKKMASYFLEHVRNRYKLTTNELDERFINSLHYKTGVDEREIGDIVFFIKSMDQVAAVSDRQLIIFHKQLESFYKKA